MKSLAELIRENADPRRRPPLAELIRLDGQNAIVTGGAGGLGGTISRRLASAGASILIVDIDEQAAIDHAAQIESEFSVRAVPLAADPGLSGEAKRIVAASERELGKIDILVNTAGGRGVGRFLEQTEERMYDIVHRNLLTFLYMTRAAAEAMVPHGKGAIVSISSQASLHGWATGAVYGGCKGAINSVTRTLGQEFRELGIRINAVAPAVIASSRLAAVAEDAAQQELYASSLQLVMDRTALGRPSMPEEVADVVVILASDLCSYVHGTTWEVAGGMD